MKSYCIYITFKTPQALYKAHNNNIKALNFILGDSETILEDARRNALNYINDYLKNLDVETPYITQVPITPSTPAEWKEKPVGYFCTEEPCHWKLTVWKKNIIKGYLFNSFEVEEIFHIDILQVFEETCQGSPTRITGFRNFQIMPDEDLITPILKKRKSLPCKSIRFGSVIEELKGKIQNGVKLTKNNIFYDVENNVDSHNSTDNESNPDSDISDDNTNTNSDASENLVSDD